MSQRPSAAGQSHQDGSTAQQQAPDHSFPPDNHLMPQSLRKIPDWYQDGPFRYNRRVLAGFLPGALLIATVEGRLLIAAAVLGVLVILLMRSMGSPWLAMILSVGHVFALEVTNIYCMAPLIWHSVLNLPLYLLFHAFIAFSGIWWWLQDEEFRKQDPRVLILMERVVFYVFPAISVTMVTWIFGMLFGPSALPYVVCLSGVVALGVYVVPLQSSFAKPQTPTETGQIQHRVIAWVYVALELCVPVTLFTALSYNGSLHSVLTVGLLVAGPPFLLTLLDSQGFFYWTVLGQRAVQVIRAVTGGVVLSLFSIAVYTSVPSSILPHLLIPIVFTQLGLVSAVSGDPTHFSLVPVVLSLGLALLYTVAFTQLPWTIAHYFTFLSLPLSVVQLLMWCVTIATVAMVTLWKSVTAQVWIVYNVVFVACEYILSWDDVYPPYLSVATATMATVLFWRLNSVGRLPLASCLLSICLHFTKFSLLLPSSDHTPTSSTLTTIVAIFLVSLMLLRVMAFGTHSSPLSLAQLMVYSGLLLTGLVLSIDSLLTPLWFTLTHRLPSSATIIALILAVLGVFVSHGLSLVKEGGGGKLSSLSPGLFAVAGVLGLLQPEFNVREMIQSLLFITLGPSPIDDKPVLIDMLLVAWSNVMVWLVLLVLLVTLAAVVFTHYTWLITAAAGALGAVLGSLAALALVQMPPLSPVGCLYMVLGGLTAALMGRAYSANHRSNHMVDRVMYCLLITVFLLTFYVELTTLPHVYIPGKFWLAYYSLPCAKVMMGSTASIVMAFRARMYQMEDTSHLPLVANVSCLIFFLLSFLHPLHNQMEVSIVLSSAIFLLAQPDSLLLPKTTTIFLAPSLVASVTALYCYCLLKIVPRIIPMVHKGLSIYRAARMAELLSLVTTLPGQAVFLYYLWTGKQLKLSIVYLVLYILPNALLPQFASITASTLLGSIGITSFCLLMLGDYTNLKILAH